jgi:hypothetical protein
MLDGVVGAPGDGGAPIGREARVDEAHGHEEDETVAHLRAAREHAEHLRHRLEGLAAQIAESEDSIADVYEQSARVRPHAAERLQEAARHAREFAARERASLRDPDDTGSGDQP